MVNGLVVRTIPIVVTVGIQHVTKAESNAMVHQHLQVGHMVQRPLLTEVLHLS